MYTKRFYCCLESCLMLTALYTEISFLQSFYSTKFQELKSYEKGQDVNI